MFDSDLSTPRGELLTWAYRLASYDAVALGGQDLMYGRKIGVEKFRALGVPWVCSNMESGREELSVRRYAILNRGGRRIVVVALLGKVVHRDALTRGNPPVVLSDPREALESLLPELRAQADVICLLAHMPSAQAEQIFAKTNGIDVLVLGHDQRLTTPDPPDAVVTLKRGNRYAPEPPGETRSHSELRRNQD